MIHEKGNFRPLRFDHDDVGEEGAQGEEEERLSRILDLNRILSRSSGIPSLHFDNFDIYIEPLYYKGDTNFVHFSDQSRSKTRSIFVTSTQYTTNKQTREAGKQPIYTGFTDLQHIYRSYMLPESYFLKRQRWIQQV